MADPLSVAASCIGVISAAGSTAKAILTFIKDCREARSDLTSISRELTDLQITLEILKDDGEGDALPPPLRSQIVLMVNSCGSVISDIDDVLRRHKGRGGSLRWAADGKREVEGLRRGLETHRASLSLTVEAVTLSLAKSIKSDTEAIRGQTSAIPDIKGDTERILDVIEELRISVLPREEQAWSKSPLLDDYLDGLTSYAETVCEEVVWESDTEDDTEDEEEEDRVVTEITTAEEGEGDNDVQGNGAEDVDQTRQSICEDGLQTKAKEDMEHGEEKEMTLAAHNVSSDEGNESKKTSAEEHSESEERVKRAADIDCVRRKHRRTDAKGLKELLQRIFPRCGGCGYVRKTDGEDKRPMIRIQGKERACADCIRAKSASSISSSTNMATNRPKWERWGLSSWLLASQAERMVDRASQAQYNRKYRRVSFECPIADCGRTHEITSNATQRNKVYCRYQHRSVCSWCFKKWHSQTTPECKKDGDAQQLFDLSKVSQS